MVKDFSNYDLWHSHPLFVLQDQVIGWWFDQWVLAGVKLYYWPAFVAGSADNVVDLFNPRTYTICRI
jgi:hypothetical protein